MATKWFCFTDQEQKVIRFTLGMGNSYEKERKSIIKKLDKSEKRITTASAKGKGRNLQYWVCEKVANLFNVKFEQGNDQCLIHSREMGQHGLDIIFRGKIFKKFPYSIECKNSESLSIIDTINQVKANQVKNTDWLIIHKRKALPSPIVILDWEAFERLIVKINLLSKKVT